MEDGLGDGVGEVSVSNRVGDGAGDRVRDGVGDSGGRGGVGAAGSLEEEGNRRREPDDTVDVSRGWRRGCEDNSGRTGPAVG